MMRFRTQDHDAADGRDITLAQAVRGLQQQLPNVSASLARIRKTSWLVEVVRCRDGRPVVRYVTRTRLHVLLTELPLFMRLERHGRKFGISPSVVVSALLEDPGTSLPMFGIHGLDLELP